MRRRRRGERAAASRLGPVLVRAGDWLRPPPCARRGPRCRRGVGRRVSPSHNSFLGYPFNRS